MNKTETKHEPRDAFEHALMHDYLALRFERWETALGYPLRVVVGDYSELRGTWAITIRPVEWDKAPPFERLFAQIGGRAWLAAGLNYYDAPEVRWSVRGGRPGIVQDQDGTLAAAPLVDWDAVADAEERGEGA